MKLLDFLTSLRQTEKLNFLEEEQQCTLMAEKKYFQGILIEL